MEGSCKPRISVLMPAYNVEKYIAASLDSLLQQTYQDFEIVVVNDGSTDQTGSILESYRKRDPRVRVIHQENQGISVTRNRTLELAEGDYITFIDSDDTVKPEYLEKLYETALEKDADMVFCPYYGFLEEKGTFQMPLLEDGYLTKEFTGEELYHVAYTPVNTYEVVSAVIWGKLLKRSLLDGIVFPAGKVHEDNFTTYKIYLKAKRIIYYNEALYMYRKRAGSIVTGAWSRERIRNCYEFHEERMALLAAAGIPVSQDQIADYQRILRTTMKIALENGYATEYQWIKQKLYFMNFMRSKNNLS